MIHSIICTRDKNYLDKKITEDLFIYLSWLENNGGHSINKVKFMVNQPSIFEGYENGLIELKPQSKDIIILCHDDIEILSKKEHFLKCLHLLNKDKIGFIGVAGSTYYNGLGGWWQMPRENLRGTVWHGDDSLTAQPTPFGPNGDAVVMDGVFLACRAELLHKIGLKKPKDFDSNWDFYDMLFTLKTHILGYKNYVVPIHIMHNSPGAGVFKESWNNSRIALVNKYSKYLPRSI